MYVYFLMFGLQVHQGVLNMVAVKQQQTISKNQTKKANKDQV